MAGIGTVKWILVSDDGRLLTLNLRACYVSACKQRLLSLQKIFSHDHDVTGSFVVNGDHACLLIDKSPTLIIPFDLINNLPSSKCILCHVVEQNVACLNLCVTKDRNQNLSEAQKEYLQLHFCLGHLGADTIQWVL